MKQTHVCCSEKEMIELAAGIARTLRGGEVFALVGELGSGKTTFVKGLALGLKIPVTATSPTFNLVHRYTGGRLPLIHYDLFRLKKLAEIEALDLETELQQKNVIAIEWPQIVKPILPADRTRWIEFQETRDLARTVVITNRS